MELCFANLWDFNMVLPVNNALAVNFATSHTWTDGVDILGTRM